MNTPARQPVVFVVTVGISLLLKKNDDAVRLELMIAGWQRGSTLPDEVSHGIRDYWRRWEGEDRRQLPAELATLWVSDAEPPDGDQRVRVRAGDHVVLLCSDTKEGEACGRVLAELVGEVAGATSEVRVLKDMAADLGEGFEDAAARELGSALGAAYQRALDSGGRLSFHLNGGYKATLPLFVYLVRHLPAAPVRSEALLLHENGTRPIRLPVLQAGVSKQLRAELEAAAKGTAITNDYLDYAYTRRADGRYELTLLGGVLRDLAELDDYVSAR